MDAPARPANAVVLRRNVHRQSGSRCRMDAWIGNCRAPLFELGVQIIKITEASTQKEILPHIAEGAFSLTLGFGSIRLTCARRRPVTGRWHVSPRTLERWRWTGEGPAFVKIGGRVVYRIEDVETYERRRRCESIAQATALVRVAVTPLPASCRPSVSEAQDPDHPLRRGADDPGTGASGHVARSLYATLWFLAYLTSKAMRRRGLFYATLTVALGVPGNGRAYTAWTLEAGH